MRCVRISPCLGPAPPIEVVSRSATGPGARGRPAGDWSRRGWPGVHAGRDGVGFRQSHFRGGVGRPEGSRPVRSWTLPGSPDLQLLLGRPGGLDLVDNRQRMRLELLRHGQQPGLRPGRRLQRGRAAHRHRRRHRPERSSDAQRLRDDDLHDQSPAAAAEAVTQAIADAQVVPAEHPPDAELEP